MTATMTMTMMTTIKKEEISCEKNKKHKAAAFQTGNGYDAYDGVSAYLRRLRALQAG